MRLFKLSLAFLAVSAETEVIFSLFFYTYIYLVAVIIINFQGNQSNAPVQEERSRRFWPFNSKPKKPERPACKYSLHNHFHIRKVFKLVRVHFLIIY